MRESRNFWIRSAWFDSCFILAPAFLISAVVLAVPSIFQRANQETPLWGWVVFILCIDVAHVYGTLYRTYFHPSAREEQSRALWMIPLFGWISGLLLYSHSSVSFWRVIAYVAVFHFIRQQYGFVRIYSRQDELSRAERAVNSATIYAATLYPLVFWHTHLPRNFSWFNDGDFFAASLEPSTLARIDSLAFVNYLVLLGSYFALELRRYVTSRRLNLPRLAVVAGTTLSWYLGIVVFDGDLAFTATNVVAHGIPYMALTWAYWHKTQPTGANRSLAVSASVFLASLLAFAYLEEWLWEVFVAADHGGVFPVFQGLHLELSDATLSWLVPLLILPQLTHYVLDGFIWKMKEKGSEWKSMLAH